jgi:hypothetical protein
MKERNGVYMIYIYDLCCIQTNIYIYIYTYDINIYIYIYILYCSSSWAKTIFFGPEREDRKKLYIMVYLDSGS